MFSTRPAYRMMTAISGQEAAFKHRRQINGPARGLWQFERGGGVRGVLRHPSTARYAKASCEVRLIEPKEWDVWEALAEHDDLAAIFARLLLWSDPKKLPTTQDDAWECYLRNWRPGKPHPDRWPKNWSEATDQDVAYFTTCA